MSAADLKKELAHYARSLGFERFGVLRAERLETEEEHLKRWIAEGRAGGMDYLTKDPERRSRPTELLPGAKSVIALAMNYSQPSPFPLPKGRGPGVAFSLQGEGGRRPDEGEGRVARYTRGPDYHKLIRKRLDGLVRYLEALAPGTECRTFLDTGPLLERAAAQRAGIGFVGKNTMLITKGLGSWVFLASVVTTLELPADAPDARTCGECRLCIDACPTQAITEPFHLDARRCIAYLTIEQKGPIPQALRTPSGPWVFGCDICQEVCPHNTRRTSPSPALGLAEILSLQTEDEFRNRFRGTAVTRAGHEGLVRNACVAAANLGRQDLKPQLKRLAESAMPLVREHAAWALKELESTSGPKNASAPAPAISAREAEAASRR